MSKDNDEWVGSWEGTAWGEKLGGDLPANHLGYAESHMMASDEKVQAAATYWPQRDPRDFDPVGTTGRRIVDRTTGEQYSLVLHDVFQSERPEEENVAFYMVHSGWIWFLKVYPAIDTSVVGLNAASFGGEIKYDRRSGKAVLVDAGRRVATRLTEGRRL